MHTAYTVYNFFLKSVCALKCCSLISSNLYLIFIYNLFLFSYHFNVQNYYDPLGQLYNVRYAVEHIYANMEDDPEQKDPEQKVPELKVPKLKDHELKVPELIVLDE